MRAPSSPFILIVTLLGGVGGWIVSAPSWASLTTTSSVGGLFIILGSTAAAAFGVKSGGMQ